ncbi:MAG: DUF2924 domain-containing protein [Sphingomonadales bacterium]|nr:DUF2924 domain-containing protein [Sphingomonadales bacterium]
MTKIVHLDQVTELATMSPAQLRDAWLSHNGAPAPNLSADLLRLGLAYRVQENALGGLTAPVRRQLEGSGHAAVDGATLKPGTRLLRTWNGRSVSVTVTETGFDYDGKAWASLTAIAKSVTGFQCSGPRFFGIGRHARS